MNIVSRFFTGLAGGLEGMIRGWKEFDIDKPWEWMYSLGFSNSSGVQVNAANAMQIAAFYACVRVISEDLGKISLKIYKKLDNGTVEEASKHPLTWVMNEAANGWQSGMDFREMMQAIDILKGNAYALKVTTTQSNGGVTELVPIQTERVQPKQRSDGTPYYVIDPPRNEPGPARIYTQDQIYHERGLTLNGFTGVSVIEYQAELLGFALAQTKYGGKMLSNGGRPGGVLSHPGKLKEDARARLKASWDEAYSGDGQGGTAVLEEGIKWETLSMKNVDMQYLETMKYTRTQIAGMLRVPPHKIADLERSTNNNIEHQSIEYVTDCLLGWARRRELAIARQLIMAKQTYYAEHLLESLLRGDLKSRYDAYAIARQWGWMSANDVRKRENMNPIPDGDVYLQPMNMGPAGALPVAPDATPPSKEVQVMLEGLARELGKLEEYKALAVRWDSPQARVVLPQ